MHRQKRFKGLGLCASSRRPVREARVRASRPIDQAGGIQPSLDLSSAFDLIEWVHLAEAMDDANVPAELQAHVLEWYRDLRYIFTIQGHYGEVEASRGLKQGCLMARLLWSLAIGRMLHKLALDTDAAWVSREVTAYADDFYAAHTARNLTDLLLAENYLSQFLDILLQAGMNFNAAKSGLGF